MHKLPITIVEHTVGILTEIEAEAFSLMSRENSCFMRTRNKRSDDTLPPSYRSHTAVVLWMKTFLLLCSTSTKHKTWVYGLPWMINHVIVDK